MQKLEILTDAARFDVACTSSGVERKGDGKHMGNCAKAGICHSFSSDGRCISLLKILMTNECIFDCKYCMNRKSNDVPRATFTPEEICTLTMEFYRRNYIEGLFLSSGIVQDPTFTMELLYRTIWLLRNHYHFNGYVHVKAIPGADPELVQRMGYLADRMSVNLELPTAEPNGERNVSTCHYLDADSAMIDGKKWNLLEFAKEMEKRGIMIAPMELCQVPERG